MCVGIADVQKALVAEAEFDRSARPDEMLRTWANDLARRDLGYASLSLIPLQYAPRIDDGSSLPGCARALFAH